MSLIFFPNRHSHATSSSHDASRFLTVEQPKIREEERLSTTNGHCVRRLAQPERATLQVTFPGHQPKVRKSTALSHPSAADSSKAGRDGGSRRRETQRACRRARFPKPPFRPPASGLCCPISHR